MVRVGAVEAIGGFPTESVTEDFLLTLRLSENGWRTVYLNEPLTEGLAPEGLQEYIVQRGRWCLGMMQIVRGAAKGLAGSTMVDAPDNWLNSLMIVEPEPEPFRLRYRLVGTEVVRFAHFDFTNRYADDLDFKDVDGTDWHECYRLVPEARAPGFGVAY